MNCKNCPHKQRAHSGSVCRVAFCPCTGFEEEGMTEPDAYYTDEGTDEELDLSFLDEIED